MQVAPIAALIVVDVQKGLAEGEYWGRRNNPQAETNMARLIDRWQSSGRPIVMVRHDSVEPASPLRPGLDGNAFKPEVADADASLLVTKSVNSAFFGTPDLNAWLADQAIAQIAVVGIQTNMCCESTARVGADLGYDVVFVADATHTFDQEGPDGQVLTADDLTRATTASLHGGGFATVASTDDVLAAL